MLSNREATEMQLFHGHHEEKLKCPYKGCEKIFDKPTIITDASVIPRQTHYACPFCMSKLEITTANEKIISVKPTEYPIVFDSLQRTPTRTRRNRANTRRMPNLPQSTPMRKTQKIKKRS
jgi:predicted nucleotide-binding protein (sugar kinase/HSP70/actin superfamily)